MRKLIVWVLILNSAIAFSAPARKKGTPAEAAAFVKKLDVELRRLYVRASTADWIRSTDITDDSERNSAALNADLSEYTRAATIEAARFQGLKLDPETARIIYLLRISPTLPAPADPLKRDELTATAAKLEGIYGKGKYCGKDGKGPCRDLNMLEDVLATSRNYDELLEVWTGWRKVSPPMRPLFERLVSLANEGSRAIAFKDTAELWKSNYDMTPAELDQDTDRLWGQMKPLYDDLHCYVRGKLSARYGAAKVPDQGPIPAHLLGNMWAQEWGNIYPLAEPFPGQSAPDVTASLKAAGYDETKLVKLGESFYTSLGLDPLPATFWTRSLLKKPRDREVVCHASAWDVQYNDDLRIKMCVKVDADDLVTVHHELGHDYYFHAYYRLPVLFQQGANDGFHEAIGDAIALSVTPAYLKKVGVLKDVPAQNDKSLIDQQLREALDKVAFLPFALMIDNWRWKVFSGEIKPAQFNQAWWDLALKYQGIKPPVTRSEQDFDPGAKYHIASNTPYYRYFIARLLQFQFYKAMCDAAGFKGPLAQCSVYGNKEAGKKLQAMLVLGRSKPWQDALQQIAGTRQVDAGPMLEYFQPLRTWLTEQNKGKRCGW